MPANVENSAVSTGLEKSVFTSIPKKHNAKELSNHTSALISQVKSLSRVRLFETPWTVAHQGPPPVGFSRQQYWRGLPFPSPGDLPDPGIEPGLLHCRQILYWLSYEGSKFIYCRSNSQCDVIWRCGFWVVIRFI